MDAALETIGLRKRFGAVTAAADISLRFQRGTITGLIGSNGAGKTTFVNMVTGHLRPDAGRILVEGREVIGMKPRALTRIGLARSFQIPQLFGNLTVSENLAVAFDAAAEVRPEQVSSRPAAREGAIVDALDKYHLHHYRDEPVSTLPNGVRKLLDIAMAMASAPRILLLDEPTSGVSSAEKFSFTEHVLQVIRDEPVTIIFIEHDMDIVREYAERVVAFYSGSIISDGPPDTVLNDEDVVRHVTGSARAPAGPAGV